MSEDGHSHGKGKIPSSVWLGLGLVIVGMILGSYLSPIIDPILHPERASLVQDSQALKTQNALLKQQVDCLVNGINQSHGKTTLSECT